MKRKNAIVNFALMLTVLFAILFQSLHSYEHILSDHEHEIHICDHDFSSDSDSPQKTVLKTAHEKCTVCDFAFSAFVAPEHFQFQLFDENVSTAYQFSIRECLFFFSGSLFSLRAPPALA